MLQKHGWFDAYANHDVFRRDMERELTVYTRIPGEPGMLK
jgi:hypothetical protein